MNKTPLDLISLNLRPNLSNEDFLDTEIRAPNIESFNVSFVQGMNQLGTNISKRFDTRLASQVTKYFCLGGQRQNIPFINLTPN